MRKNTEINIEDKLSRVEIKGKIQHIKLILTSLFIISAIYFFWFANYIFFYQESQSLFIYSNEYFRQFADRPGGLLEYAGNFLTQGYFNYVYGSIILATLFTLIAIVYIKINKNLSPERSFNLPLILIPSCLLILIQTNINWLIHHNLGFLLTGLYFLLSIISDKKSLRIISLTFFPVFFYVTGGYAWIFVSMYILYGFIYEKWIFPVLLLIIAFVSLVLFKEVLFLQPLDLLMYYHLPIKDFFRNPLFFYMVMVVIIAYPVLIKISCIINLKNVFIRSLTQFTAPLILIVTIFLLSQIYNADTVHLMKLEKFTYRQDWDKVIEYQEAVRSPNIIAQYYYNLALSEKGQLCDRMFSGPQNFGPNSLLIPWNDQTSINNVFRGVYFFYSIGLVNEAHRWAYESMVVQGYRPENIKLLIKTDLINGNYRIASKYISVLKRTLHYRSWAEKYEAMVNNPEMIKSDPELGEKMRLQPKGDFPVRIKNPQANVLLLLQTNPNHKKAFEYKLAWFLLEKNVGAVVTEIKKMKEMAYTKIPRHIEEAALAFSVHMGPVPDLRGLEISAETKKSFDVYESALDVLNLNKSMNEKSIQNAGRNTFWFYLDFK